MEAATDIMMFRDITSRIVIDPRKLTEYALNPESDKGESKAVLFQKHLGFTRHNYELLLEQIEAKALNAEIVLGLADQHGQRYRADLEIIGAEGQRGIVRTGWIVGAGSDIARLTTLYVIKR